MEEDFLSDNCGDKNERLIYTFGGTPEKDAPFGYMIVPSIHDVSGFELKKHVFPKKEDKYKCVYGKGLTKEEIEQGWVAFEEIPKELPSNMGMRRIFPKNENEEYPCEMCEFGKT